MKVKTSDLIGEQLDCAVAYCKSVCMKEDCEPYRDGSFLYSRLMYFPSPSTEWSIGGPIIHKHDIAITNNSFPYFATEMGWWGHIRLSTTGYTSVNGPTPLIAAMRALVTYTLGYEVDMEKIYEGLQIKKE
jgi:hypothetical protein